jgi:hypothetical protein
VRFHSVQDITESEAISSQVDVAIFCTGFESRCTHMPSRFKEQGDKADVHIFGFNDQKKAKTRVSNDIFYKKNFDSNIELFCADEYDKILVYLNKLTWPNDRDNISILFDYTSMTRQWYAAILSWCKFQKHFKRIILYATYSIGIYGEETRPMVIQEISSLPGFSGTTLAKQDTALIFGLGFEGDASLCVIEQLEPSIIYTFIANPAASDKSYERSIAENEYIKNLSNAHLEYSLFSVEETFRGLSEILIAQPKNTNIVTVPMGPKPHILATLLLGLRYQELTCIRVSGRGKKGENVQAEGRIVTTKIIFC